MTKSTESISTNMINRYTERYLELGYDVKTLGWGNKEQQEYRFKQAINEVDFESGKSVLDIGCGFGDLLTQLIVEKKPITQYIGWDINSNLIAESNKIWKDSKIPSQFKVVNVLEEKINEPVADIGLMIGVLNLNHKSNFNNYEYSKLVIENAFSTVKELLVVDFLSSKTSSKYPVEDFVFYHDPLKMLEFGFSLSANVVLKHNYAPIPQKEFMLFIYK